MTCQFKAYLRKMPENTLPDELRQRVKTICVKAEPDGTITASAARVTLSEQKELIKFGVWTLEKQTDKATTTIYRLCPENTVVKFWWKRRK